jgi:hypothetical protein
LGLTVSLKPMAAGGLPLLRFDRIFGPAICGNGVRLGLFDQPNHSLT